METFIHQQFLSDISVCDQLIDLHKKSEKKTPGTVFTVHEGRVIDHDIKESIDITLVPGEVASNYYKQLQEVVDAYIDKFSCCNDHAPWGIVSPVNIQYYSPGGGYKVFHAERGSTLPHIAKRHLVFMTYLNDVVDNGGTEFLYQKIIVQPKKGLTLIWPADWTHTHRGVVSPTQEKYIITGWFNFIDPNTSK